MKVSQFRFLRQWPSSHRLLACCFGLAALLIGPTLVSTEAAAQVKCLPSEVSNTIPLQSCLNRLQQEVPGVQAAIFGTQNLAMQSTQIIVDRATELRAVQQGGSGQAFASAANPTAAYAKAGPVYKAKVAEPAPEPSWRPAAWFRAFGDYERRNETFTLAPGGVPLAVVDSYRQRSGGVMGGFDTVISRLTSANDGLILGVSGGYLSSTIEVAGGRNRLSGPTLGAYGTYIKGAWFTDLIGKVDFLSFDSSIVGLPLTADVRNSSLLWDLGYKFDLPNKYYIEPVVGLEYVRTDISNQAIVAGAFTALEDAHLLRSRFGARFGTEWVSNNIRIEPSATLLGYYFMEATGPTISLGAAGGTIVLPTDQHKFRGELQASINAFNLTTGWSGFVRGDLRFGDNVTGGGGKVGIRYQW
jgi:outer membrane autotransporter protein